MPKRKSPVLVVEDEQAISDLLAFHLEQSGFLPLVVTDARLALEWLHGNRRPALVILDLTLPLGDGLDILKRIRRDKRLAPVPVILLTARAEEADRILGLELGADDYVAKPFSPRELMLRVQRLIDSRQHRAPKPVTFTSGCITVDESRFAVTVEGEPVIISATEMRLLVTLLEERETVLSRTSLLEQAWGYMPNVTARTVDTHIKRLRQKLGAAADYIETVRGVGYRWVGPPE